MPSSIEQPKMAAEFEKASDKDTYKIYDVVIKAYESESTWNHAIEEIKKRMKKHIEETLKKDDLFYIIARNRNNEIIAVSRVAKYHETQQNFLTGICILPGYKRLGIGTNLLYYFLTTLKAFGMKTAQVFTEKESVAAKKIYPLFNSECIANVPYLGIN